jgi:hypothetical protein
MCRLLPPRVLCVVAGAALAAPAGAGEPAAGPYTLKLSGQLRVRMESEDSLDLRGYRPDFTDTFALSRLSLEMDAHAKDWPRFHLQLRDARAFGSTLGDDDFSASNPIHDPLDVREAFVEWRGIGGSALGFTIGRQRIPYGDERVFGPGEWGNTGRWTWDAARGHYERGALWADAWVGRAVVNRPDRWPNSSADGVRAAVLYGGFRRGQDRVDLFAGEKRDDTVRRGERGAGSLRCRFVGVQAAAAVAGPWRWGGDCRLRDGARRRRLRRRPRRVRLARRDARRALGDCRDGLVDVRLGRQRSRRRRPRRLRRGLRGRGHPFLRLP